MTSDKLFDELFALEGKTALVTGGTKGLGRVMADTLAAAGANVAICSRNADEAESVASEIASASGRQTLGLRCDVSDSAQVQEMVAAIESQLGGIDILIANAGINIRKDTFDLTEDDWDAVIDINLKGAFLCAKATMRAMQDRGWGRIIFLGSILSFISIPGRAAYASSKTALLGLTRTLALEGAEDGVCVNAICPGPFATPMNTPVLSDPEKNARFIANIPVGRWGDPSELRGLTLYLSSPASSFTTGSEILIDGGWTSR